MSDIDANDFLMSTGVRSASFANVGDTVVGHIIRKPEVRQQRNFDTGEPLFWADGNPRMQMVIVLMTEEQDPGDAEDSGERSIYARGNMLAAIRTAVRQSGARGLEVGGKLLVKFSGEGTPTRRGLNAPKLYEAKYRAPKDEPVPVPETAPAPAAVQATPNNSIPF
jgi:hypothetical protein